MIKEALDENTVIRLMNTVWFIYFAEKKIVNSI